MCGGTDGHHRVCRRHTLQQAAMQGGSCFATAMKWTEHASGCLLGPQLSSTPLTSANDVQLASHRQAGARKRQRCGQGRSEAPGVCVGLVHLNRLEAPPRGVVAAWLQQQGAEAHRQTGQAGKQTDKQTDRGGKVGAGSECCGGRGSRLTLGTGRQSMGVFHRPQHRGSTANQPATRMPLGWLPRSLPGQAPSTAAPTRAGCVSIHSCAGMQLPLSLGAAWPGSTSLPAPALLAPDGGSTCVMCANPPPSPPPLLPLPLPTSGVSLLTSGVSLLQARLLASILESAHHVLLLLSVLLLPLAPPRLCCCAAGAAAKSSRCACCVVSPPPLTEACASCVPVLVLLAHGAGAGRSPAGISLRCLLGDWWCGGWAPASCLPTHPLPGDCMWRCGVPWHCCAARCSSRASAAASGLLQLRSCCWLSCSCGSMHSCSSGRSWGRCCSRSCGHQHTQSASRQSSSVSCTAARGGGFFLEGGRRGRGVIR